MKVDHEADINPGGQMQLKVFIPTRGRPDRQICAEVLMNAGIPCSLVVAKNDPSDYSMWQDKIIRVDATNIGEKRQAILELATGKFVMMDDDLKFRIRTPENKFRQTEAKDIVLMLEMIDARLDQSAHVGITDEFMCQHTPRGFRVGGRYSAVLAYNKALFPSPAPKFRLSINEEHDMNLQLQQAGLAPSILCEFTRGQKYYAAGGLSTYRTPEVEAAQHKMLAELWPDVVRIKDCKTSISGLRVTFNWRRIAMSWKS